MKNQKCLTAAAGSFAAFVLWTAAVCLVDVQAIGPEGSAVGMASLNRFIHRLTGVHWSLYVITDWLSLIPLGWILGFAVLGLAQWIQRQRLLHVDHDILFLGGFYAVVMGAYLLFETVVVNYRPVLIEGILEPSYPSSTTMLTMCVMLTAMVQIRMRTGNRMLMLLMAAFTGFMVIGRLISGVHWFTDIVGGVLLSAALVLLYISVCRWKPQ